MTLTVNIIIVLPIVDYMEVHIKECSTTNTLDEMTSLCICHMTWIVDLEIYYVAHVVEYVGVDLSHKMFYG